MLNWIRRELLKGRRLFATLSIWMLVTALAVQHSESQAQGLQPTPEMREMLNQLPASQREAVLRQLRGTTASNVPATSSSSATQTPIATQPSEPVPVFDEASARFVAGDTLVLTVTGGAESGELISRIREHNPYTINEDGELAIPGIAPMPIAGLTEAQAEVRLESEPMLAGLDFSVVLLPVAPAGEAALEPFGYDLFLNAQIQPADELMLPVPSDYTIGPGDVIRVQLFGAQNAAYELFVERDGSILFPELGPLTVAGMSFEQVREFVAQRVDQQLIGTQVSVSMGALRSVQVFLVGDVNAPGSYSVGALSTITTVLTAGGGVAESGSLRRIQLKRDGQIVNILDVYSLLLRGDSSGDVRVRSGDVVFVPPVGTQVSIVGEVRRPAIYEYRGAANVEDVIGLAGGVSASAYTAGVTIQRLNAGSGYLTVSADLDSESGRKTLIEDGDVVFVPGVLERLNGTVRVVGNAERPGSYQWRDGIRLSDILEGPQSVKPGTDLGYVLIRRESDAGGGPEFFSADLRAAWRMRGSPVDLILSPRDTLYVFDLVSGRGQFVSPLLEDAAVYSSSDNPVPVVSVVGSVNSPGRFPLERGMRVSDLVRAGGGLSQSAFTGEAELTRYDVVDDERTSSVVSINIGAALDGDPDANVELRSFDTLHVREVPQWREEEFVELVGEFAFPGIYTIRRGETLSSVIERAGGLTEFAFAGGNVFTRAELREREREQLADLAERVESDLANLTLSDPSQIEGIGAGQTLLRQLRATEAVGRLVIDLDKVLSGDTDIALRGGDVLRVPQRSQSVTVIGEVQYSTSHLYDSRLDRDDYIERSGGTTANADKRRIYVVRANGEVVVNSGSRFLSRSSGHAIQPGDTIVVPLDTDRVQPLALWTGITQVLYNVAIAAAAVQSFN